MRKQTEQQAISIAQLEAENILIKLDKERLEIENAQLQAENTVLKLDKEQSETTQMLPSKPSPSLTDYTSVGFWSLDALLEESQNSTTPTSDEPYSPLAP